MITVEELWDHLVGHMKNTNDRLAAIDRLQELAASGHTEKRIEEVERWIQTLKRCIEDHEQTVRIHQERHEALNERLEQLDKRQDVLDSRLSLHMRVMEHANRPRHLVPCPVCDGECCEHYRGDGTADDPPDYGTCLFCEGSGEVAECQAVHVRVLQTKIRRLESELGIMRHQRDHWRSSPPARAGVGSRPVGSSTGCYVRPTRARESGNRLDANQPQPGIGDDPSGYVISVRAPSDASASLRHLPPTIKQSDG